MELYQNTDNSIPISWANQIIKRYPKRIQWTDHVKYLILDILEDDGVLAVPPHLVLDGSEKEVERVNREAAFMSGVQHAEEISQWLKTYTFHIHKHSKW